MQAIPQIFVEKINADRAMREIASKAVIPFMTATNALKRKNVLRNQCKISLAIHKVNPDGSGSPVAMVA